MAWVIGQNRTISKKNQKDYFNIKVHHWSMAVGDMSWVLMSIDAYNGYAHARDGCMGLWGSVHPGY